MHRPLLIFSAVRNIAENDCLIASVINGLMESFLTSHLVMSRLSSDRIARDNSSSPSSVEETQKIEDFGEADISSQGRRVISSEV